MTGGEPTLCPVTCVQRDVDAKAHSDRTYEHRRSS